MMLTLGNWEPDRAAPDTGLLVEARNAHPSSVGWEPMGSLTEHGSTALPSACLGLFFAKSKTGSYQVFAGTATKLYKLVAGTWTDYSRLAGGNYAASAASRWRAAQFGELFILVNGIDAPQVLDIDGVGVNFAALAGTPPTASDISVVGDFVFLNDSTNERRLVWCGTSGPNTASSWTIGTALCDEYIAPDGGGISVPMLGEYGLCLQTDGMARRVVLQPGDPVAAFRFEKIEGARGYVHHNSAVEEGGKIFYLAEDGWYSLSADGANTPIGTARVNDWFLRSNGVDLDRLEQIIGIADPERSRIYWLYHTTPTATVYDGMLGYDWLLDRWFHGDGFGAYALAPVAVPGITLEQLGALYPDLDAVPASLDSRQFNGGRITLGGVSSDGYLAFLDGPFLQTTFRTAPNYLIPGRRALVSEVEPIGEWGDSTLSLRIGHREKMTGSPAYTAPQAPSSETGIVYPRISARVFEFELTIAASGDWQYAQAISTTEQQDGAR
jgi:hypothetical protein